MIVHLPEQVANQGTRVLGMKRAVQLQGAQQLLPDRVVVRMAPGAQAGLVQRLGPSVKSAEQWPPIDNIMLRGFSTSSDAAAVERRRITVAGLFGTALRGGELTVRTRAASSSRPITVQA